MTPEVVLIFAAVVIAVWFQWRKGSMLPFALAALITIAALWALSALGLGQNPSAGGSLSGLLIEAVGIVVGLVYGLLHFRREGK